MIEDVVNGVREAFVDEGVDEAVLLELKQIWENKLSATKAIEPLTDPAEASLQNKISQSKYNSHVFYTPDSNQIICWLYLSAQQSAATTSANTTTQAPAARQAASRSNDITKRFVLLLQSRRYLMNF